jgi:hypothetical protein
MQIPPENIHWLFGTSMQVIATFVGLLAAGFFFFHDRLESELSRDETLREIYDDIKKRFYRRFKMLFTITSASIIMGFGVLFTAAAGIRWHTSIILTIVGLLHLFNLVFAAWFFIFLINPDIIQSTAQKLIKNNSTLFNLNKEHSISQTEFISIFWSLEKLLRSIASKNDTGFNENKPITFADLIQELHQRGILNDTQLKELNQISKARNISAHATIKNIEKDIGTSAEKLNKELISINDKN